MTREIKTINLEIGQRVKTRRIELKMRREDLSQISGYSYNFIQEIERGRSGLSAESLRAFAAALNVSTDYLVNGDQGFNADFLAKKLSLLPEEKRAPIVKIIDDIIECVNK